MQWQCPICLKNYSVEHVIVDPYFNRITSKVCILIGILEFLKFFVYALIQLLSSCATDEAL